MENLDGPLRLVDRCHFDKTVALGLVSISIVNYFNTPH